jgi:septal ring factor EnvC (AmiA/AmiB activator)
MRAPDHSRPVVRALARGGGLALVIAAAALARADEAAPASSLVDDAADTGDGPASAPLAAPARAPLAVQLDAQRRAARRAHEQVASKLAERVDIRAGRVRAAYKLLRDAGAPLAIAPEHRLAVARRQATARWLLARDRDEVEQLADEASRLAGAVDTIDRQRAALDAVPPIRLARPVPGPIARSFGTLAHAASRATLTRRGLDFDAAHDEPVRAPADGVVRYAGPIRGLDRGVILDHGGLWTVVGKLGPLAVARGGTVKRGATLGTPARRRVYLEVRLPVGPGGLPIDPAPLLE